jgi:hypothetical protein
MSPARNRVSPLGGIVAVEGRGAWMGNRGRLHRGAGTRDIVRNHQHKAWIICALSFRGRRVAQWDPHRYTPLFFFDEAVALAAGHRPCGECRHGAYTAYRGLWSETKSATATYAKDIDSQLHRERLDRADHRAAWRDLPDGVFVATDDGPRCHPWRPPRHLRYGCLHLPDQSVAPQRRHRDGTLAAVDLGDPAGGISRADRGRLADGAVSTLPKEVGP